MPQVDWPSFKAHTQAPSRSKWLLHNQGDPPPALAVRSVAQELALSGYDFPCSLLLLNDHETASSMRQKVGRTCLDFAWSYLRSM